MSSTAEKTAVFPGSFDPVTVGHESIIRRAVPLFDKIIIAIGVNATKKTMFSVERRREMIARVFEDEPKIEIADFSGLTVDFCRSVNAGFILRGLRTSADFEFERSIGQVNKMLYHGIETVFMLTSPAHTPISSSIVRDVLRYGGDVSAMVPQSIIPLLKNI